MKDQLQDEQIHNVRVIYDPDLSHLNFKEQPLTRSKYLNKLLMQSSEDDPMTRAEQWNTRYELGLLHIYIDDMSRPFMSTIINMGEMVDATLFDPKPLEVGQAYVSMSASTQNHGRKIKLDSSVNSDAPSHLRASMQTKAGGTSSQG